MERRSFAIALALGTAAAMRGGMAARAAEPDPARPGGSAEPFRIGMLAFPGLTHLDLVGPNDVLARLPGVEVYVLAKTADVIRTDTGTRILPDTTLRDAPELDMLFVGGGPGSTALMEDAETLGFLCERAPRARWVTSVCTGALVLGAAGLLRGYKAATHWTAMDVLPILGAEPVHERVVIDRNRITGGGVTAGIDFGLTVVAQLRGEETAQLMQLGSEYSPAPPFSAGSPLTAPPIVVERFQRIWARQTADRRNAALRQAATFQ